MMTRRLQVAASTLQETTPQESQQPAARSSLSAWVRAYFNFIYAFPCINSYVYTTKDMHFQNLAIRNVFCNYWIIEGRRNWIDDEYDIGLIF